MPLLQEVQEPVITWIKVEKPVFDLVGVVLGSFRLTGFLLLAALLLGVLVGAALVLAQRRRTPRPPLDDISLHLDIHAWRATPRDSFSPRSSATLDQDGLRSTRLLDRRPGL